MTDLAMIWRPALALVVLAALLALAACASPERVGTDAAGVVAPAVSPGASATAAGSTPAPAPSDGGCLLEPEERAEVCGWPPFWAR